MFHVHVFERSGGFIAAGICATPAESAAQAACGRFIRSLMNLTIRGKRHIEDRNREAMSPHLLIGGAMFARQPPIVEPHMF